MQTDTTDLLTPPELLENFSYLTDWEDKYRYLIELGDTLPPYPADKKTPAYQIEGCMSSVWITHTTQDNRHFFLMDSDAHIVRGLEAVLLCLVNNQTTEAILSLDIPLIFKQLGLETHLSQTRRNGFASMIQKIHTYISQ